jgi:hypothetical protein
MRARMHARWLLGVGGLVVTGALGIAMRAHADAPACRYFVGADTVVDRTTKLTWQLTLGTAMTYDDAIKHCNELPMDGGGFRLPTVKELQSIVDLTRSAPAIDSNTFPGLQAGSLPHWTSTTRAANEADAWYVNFADGTVYWDSKTTSIFVRCVKGP